MPPSSAELLLVACCLLLVAVCIAASWPCYAAGYLSETQPQELQGLFAALEQDCPQESVPYRDLFLQDTDLNQVCHRQIYYVIHRSIQK